MGMNMDMGMDMCIDMDMGMGVCTDMGMAARINASVIEHSATNTHDPMLFSICCGCL